MAMIVVNLFHSEWASAKGINGDIAHKTKTELDANLRLFTLTTLPQTTKNLEQCTRQLTRMIDLVPSEQQQLQQSWPAACAMIPNQQNFTKHDKRFNLNHLLGLPNRASWRYFQERSSTVAFI